MSQQQFTYDKQVYGTMDIVKFACRHAFNEFIVYGVGMEKFRFRFKDVLLNKIQKYWASASRSITIRDMQKLMNYFSSRFAETMSEYYSKEIKKLTFVKNEIKEEEKELGFTEAPEGEESEEITVEPTTTVKPEKQKHKRVKNLKTTTTPIPTTLANRESEEGRPPEEDSDLDSYTTEAPWPDSTTTPEDQGLDIQEIDEADPSEPVWARFPFVSSKKGCIRLNPKNNTFENCNNLISLSQNVKDKLFELFPYEDIEELPYMTKDHTFKIVSIPIKIRVMLSPPEKVPEILDIFQRDLSTESRDVMENCRDRFCDEPDEIVEIHEEKENNESQNSYRKKNEFKKFFQDRALRYNIDKKTTLLAYGTSSPKLSIDSSTKKQHRYRKMQLRWTFLIFLIPFVAAEICPLQNHTVCNEDIDENHICVCAMAFPDSPAPERSCNKLLDIENDEFPAISVTFKLDETARMYDLFPEDKFKEEIGSSLKEDEENIIILRQGCSEENDQLIVQFVVRDKDAEDASIPYKPDDFISPEIIVNKMKVIGFLSQIADLDVDETEVTDTLISIEGDVDNTLLIVQAIVVVAVIILTCILGVWMSCRKSEEAEYSPDLQKA